MKFAHIADCHLGGWRHPELRELNFKSFQEALKRSAKEKVDLILIAGDLFDSPYPPIETLKSTFEEFRKLKEEKIPVFLIAGSHDYSVSGRTFLDVLEKAGFCKNVSVYEERNGRIILQPTVYKNIAIYGYPGKKSGYEVEEIERIGIQDAPGLFRILMLHTAIRDAVGNSMMKSVNEKNLPSVDYVALGHLHIHYSKNKFVYPGPTFPNNLSELEELQAGSFCIFDNGRIRREEISFKKVFKTSLEVNDAFIATEKILSVLKENSLQDKIVIVRLTGVLEMGKISDIDFQKIEREAKSKGAYILLKSTSKLHLKEQDTESSWIDSAHIESDIISNFREKNESKFNKLIPNILNSLQIEKLEDETSHTFEERIISESRHILFENEI